VEGRDKDEAGMAGETGGLDDVRDTTQGPTPETRRVMRATDDDSAAAMQPDADARTRGDVGGNQDLDTDRDDMRRRDRVGATDAERIRLRRWDRGEGSMR
jgi:hypothetical protein